MGKKKLTLSIEQDLSARAKVVAERRGTSVSRLVETFFSALEAEPDGEPASEASAQAETGPGTSEGVFEDQEVSDWARRWRGAFVEAGSDIPEDSSWEEDVIAEEIREKHS